MLCLCITGLWGTDDLFAVPRCRPSLDFWLFFLGGSAGFMQFDCFLKVKGKKANKSMAERLDWMTNGELDFRTVDKSKSAKKIERENQEQKRVQTIKDRTIAQIPDLEPQKYQFGDNGASWRMSTLKRVFQAAYLEKGHVENFALDKYPDLKEFGRALQEWEFIQLNPITAHRSVDVTKKHMVKPQPIDNSPFLIRQYLDNKKKQDLVRKVSQPSSGFRKPKGMDELIMEREKSSRLDELVEAHVSNLPTRPPALTKDAFVNQLTSLSKDELNDLFAQVLKARITKSKDLETIETKYEQELSRFEMASAKIILIPEVNDSGKPRKGVISLLIQDMRKDLLKDPSLEDMVNEERSNSYQSFDSHMASSISRDSQFKDNLDYLEESTETSTRKKIKSGNSAQSRLDAKQKHTENAEEECSYCWHDGRHPVARVLALGAKTYLALPITIPLTPYHCLIIPIAHSLTSLELDDDTWSEIRNFKKSLLQMMHSMDQGAIFFEQVVNLKSHQHTIIECIPVPLAKYSLLPAYFSESLMEVEDEWSQYPKIIKTGGDVGPFKRRLVAKLPYFHVWLELDRGLGHVIEQPNEWPDWFAQEIIGGVLQIPTTVWRRPRTASLIEIDDNYGMFLEKWTDYDWTLMLL